MTLEPDAADVQFLCDFDPGFTGSAYHNAGVGGTEALVVLLAEELTRQGRRVVVSTRVPSVTLDQGVRYEPIVQAGRRAGIVVLVKQWSSAAGDGGATRVFLATDVHVPDPDAIVRCRRWAHHVCALSDFQRAQIERATGRGTISVVGAPVGLDDYREAPARRDNVLLYCSVPDRGLYYLKDIFPRIHRHVPSARLVITSDFSLWAKPSAKHAFERFFEGQQGIEYLGHIPRPALVQQQARAKVMVYPCNFPEGFCLAAAECMAAGAVPVTTRAFALRTTVGEHGVLIAGHPGGWLYQRAFARAVTRLLEDETEWRARSQACRQHVRRRYHPSQVAARLMALMRQ